MSNKDKILYINMAIFFFYKSIKITNNNTNNCKRIFKQNIFKMASFKCTFCSRTFSSKFVHTLHINHCSLSYHFSSSKKSNLITDINDILLGSENLSPNVNKII